MQNGEYRRREKRHVADARVEQRRDGRRIAARNRRRTPKKRHEDGEKRQQRERKQQPIHFAIESTKRGAHNLLSDASANVDAADGGDRVGGEQPARVRGRLERGVGRRERQLLKSVDGHLIALMLEHQLRRLSAVVCRIFGGK